MTSLNLIAMGAERVFTYTDQARSMRGASTVKLDERALDLLEELVYEQLYRISRSLTANSMRERVL